MGTENEPSERLEGTDGSQRGGLVIKKKPKKRQVQLNSYTKICAPLEFVYFYSKESCGENDCDTFKEKDGQEEV